MTDEISKVHHEYGFPARRQIRRVGPLCQRRAARYFWFGAKMTMTMGMRNADLLNGRDHTVHLTVRIPWLFG